MPSMIIPLQDSVVYGPIRSRRLGASLGINVLPVSRKVCSSNCVYCQYGWTLPSSSSERLWSDAPTTNPEPAPPKAGRVEELKRAPVLLAEIEAAFQRHAASGMPVDCITLAGNGEPTLHPDLLPLVIGIKALRDRYFPGARVGILSDATQVNRPRVRAALERCDARYMKFDAADEATWRRINLPLTSVKFQAMLEGLRTLRGIVLQSMFIQGSFDNTDEAHLSRWVEAVGSIRPLSVQVYTVDRGTAAPGITEVPRATLQAIADQLTAATRIPAEVFD